MPIIANKRAPSLWQTLFGDEKSRFAEGIKRRREGTESYDPQEYFFDPVSSELSTPTVLMTRYLEKGAPNIARRMQGTADFVKRMTNLGPHAEKAATLFAERYPRVAAHIGVEKLPLMKRLESPTGKAFTGVGTRSSGAFKEMTPVQFNKSYTGKDIEDTLLHEGTHVAQDLGNKRTLSMYGASDKALQEMGMNPREAYISNPFEISARTVAQRKMGENIPAYSALRGVDAIANTLPEGSRTQALIRHIRKPRP
jgi:hypothetical protein